jgi:hypothetical protein
MEQDPNDLTMPHGDWAVGDALAKQFQEDGDTLRKPFYANNLRINSVRRTNHLPEFLTGVSSYLVVTCLLVVEEFFA